MLQEFGRSSRARLSGRVLSEFYSFGSGHFTPTLRGRDQLHSCSRADEPVQHPWDIHSMSLRCGDRIYDGTDASPSFRRDAPQTYQAS